MLAMLSKIKVYQYYSNFFHGPFKNTVVHELKKLFLELILCSRFSLGIQYDIRLQLTALLKSNNSIYLFSISNHASMPDSD